MEHEQAEIRVLYNGKCPICSAEIAHYQAYAQKRALPIAFEDSNGHAAAAWGLTPDQAARRLHVRTAGGQAGEQADEQADGQVASGVDAFVLLWDAMPRYRPLARLVALPGLRGVAAILYDRVLAPWLYARHRRRMARETPPA